MALLTVIQTADLHNHIGLREAGRLRNLRLERQALLLDCGDAVWAGNVYVKPGPEHAIRRMNEAGYHAMALGNREFFFRATGLVMKTVEARFPVLSTNLLPRSGDLAQVQRWTILASPQGDRVGVFGLTPVMIPPNSLGELFSNLRFISHEQATREALASLRGRCDWIIALSHAGYERDRDLAARFGEIHLILGGHSHHQTEGLEVVNGVTISHIGAHGRQAAVITSLGPAPGAGFKRELVPLAEPARPESVRGPREQER